MLKIPTAMLGRNANFLALGGDSISAINLSSYLRNHNQSLSVGDILKNPRLQDMAHCLTASENNRDHLASRPANRNELNNATLLQAMVSSNVKLEDAEHAYRCPPGQAEFLSQGARSANYWVLMTILVDVVDVDEKVDRKALLNSIFSTNFVFGAPFIRYVVLKDRQNDTIELLVNMDHGLYDGTSLRILGGHFGALQRGELPPKISSFRDYANHLAYMIPQKREAALVYFTDSKRLPTKPLFPNIKDPAATSSVWVPGAISGLENLAHSTLDVSYDYLYTGRNLDIPGLDPQEINGCTANFLPIRSVLEGSVGDYLRRTQAEFWEATGHGIIGMDDIFQAAGLEREEYGNRTLFLFQPFEPSKKSSTRKNSTEEMKWVVMQGSEVTMIQPYGLIFEVHKTQAADEYRIKVTYDDRGQTENDAKQYGMGIWSTLRILREKSQDTTVDKCALLPLEDF
ncbi:hypothetical protein HD806DRAFT_538954 [Xylariaceae sp. AK1471]|nr:hypothetical protein HD806DRAFT_538954 [Xylariaceae sp. AK1471]